MEKTSEARAFGGVQQIYKHAAKSVGCDMTFAVYLPPQAESGPVPVPVPVLYWLSGLTCTEQNFVNKAGAQRYAAEHGVAIVAPDTSPRGCDIPGEDDAWDLGTGAGFYVNATQAPWDTNYRMYDYVVEELPALVEQALPLDGNRRGVFGHSMGGHGALIVALKNPERYKSVSAFAPIVAPTRVPWGHKAFGAYLGEDRAVWNEWDATELVKGGARFPKVLIDQGTADNFLKDQLQPEHFERACGDAGVELVLNRRPGYDHSYYFIATFIGEHIAHHARA